VALIDFIASLIILSFAFRVILIVLGWPVKIVFTALITPLTLGRVDKASYWATLVSPILLAVLYGGFVALVTAQYAPTPGKQTVYLICGAVAALFSIISYSAGLRAKIGGRLTGSDFDDRAYRRAATVSLVAGLAAFPAFYFYPQYIMAVPGTGLFFDWAFKLAAWLGGFKVVQIILAVAITGYVLFATVSTVFTAFLMFLGWLKSLFLRLIHRSTEMNGQTD